MSRNYGPQCGCASLEAEIATLRQRLSDVNVKDAVKTNEINILTTEVRQLQQRLVDVEDDRCMWIDACQAEGLQVVNLRQRLAGVEAERDRYRADAARARDKWACIRANIEGRVFVTDKEDRREAFEDVLSDMTALDQPRDTPPEPQRVCGTCKHQFMPDGDCNAACGRTASDDKITYVWCSVFSNFCGAWTPRDTTGGTT